MDTHRTIISALAIYAVAGPGAAFASDGDAQLLYDHMVYSQADADTGFEPNTAKSPAGFSADTVYDNSDYAVSTDDIEPGREDNFEPFDNSSNGGKLLLTNGITGIEGASGGGLAAGAVIAGNETQDGIGGSAHFTLSEFSDYGLQTYGLAIGFYDRFELSYARQNFDTRQVGALLGLGRGYKLNQDVYGAKVRLFGDLIYGDPLLPQVSVGVQHKRNLDGGVTAAIGATSDEGTDFYVSATKLFLAESIFANATARYTKANQNGLLGFGGDLNNGRELQFEGSLGYQFSRRLLIGGEYRTKPDNLSIAREDDWFDVFAAYSITRNFTVTAAYVNLGDVATAEDQHGGMISIQAAF